MAGALLVLTGCGPAFEFYHYISLEGYPDARVVERAQATPGKHRLFVGEIPTRYEIERESYTLIVAVHPDNPGPGLGLSIRPFPERLVRAARDPAPCSSWAHEDGSEWWTYYFYGCHKHKPPWEGLDKHLRFQVLDQGGNVVADEDIPYTIERDGFFMYMDAV